MERPTDIELELSIARMLLTGIVISTVVVLVGVLIELFKPTLAPPDYRHFHAIDQSLRSLPGIIKTAFQLRPDGVMQLGLVILIATPIARVVFCVIGFARQHDRLYVAVSSTVLVILIYSISRAFL